MIKNPHYQIQVTSGRKLGAKHPIPFGELSIGTTLDSQFFIGSTDMWHQLLSATASADLRSASPSRDALPEQLMRVVMTHNLNGLSLRVEKGFAEVGQKRLLPGERCQVVTPSLVRIGASELEIKSVDRPQDDTDRSHIQVGQLNVHQKQTEEFAEPSKASRIGMRLPKWMNGKAANAGLTLVAVAALSLAMLSKPAAIIAPLAGPDDSVNNEGNTPVIEDLAEHPSKAAETVVALAPVEQAQDEPPATEDQALIAEPLNTAHDGLIYNERIVAVVSSEPQFLMTESGRRFNLGAEVDQGFRVSRIGKDSIEFTRGTVTQSHEF